MRSPRKKTLSLLVLTAILLVGSGCAAPDEDESEADESQAGALATRSQTGVVKYFNTPKGYGFIKADQDGAEIFFHEIDVVSPRVAVGDRVRFDVSQGKAGGRAINVTKR
jgi:cold shock protein